MTVGITIGEAFRTAEHLISQERVHLQASTISI